MKIIIPMTGKSTRFKKSGIQTPKQFLKIQNKYILEHIIDMFPGEEDINLLVSNEDKENLEFSNYLSHFDDLIVHNIDYQYSGPGGALLESNLLDTEDDVLINYCDFANIWNWEDFKQLISDKKPDGIVFLEFKDTLPFLTNIEIYNLISFYKEYEDILFNEVVFDLENENFDINKFPEIYLAILLKYIEDNYKGKSIYKTDKLDYTLDFFESIEDMIYDELDGFLLYDPNTQTSLFLGLLPTPEKGIGYDFLLQNDDFYGYFGDDEMIQSGYIPVPKVKNNISEQGLKNTVDYILNYLVYNVIQPNEVGLNEISDIIN